jgi:hypothetical protein
MAKNGGVRNNGENGENGEKNQKKNLIKKKLSVARHVRFIGVQATEQAATSSPLLRTAAVSPAHLAPSSELPSVTV